MTSEHPFAQYVRILGKGKTGTRSLSLAEAEAAMQMILAGTVEPLQLGAFLMLLRVKEESAAELAGFVQACRAHMPPPPVDCQADLDWSSYAGKKAQQPWYILSALLLAENGIKLLMHGADGHTPGRLYSEQVLLQLGVPVCGNLAQAEQQLRSDNFAWLPLRNFCTPLHDIMQFRSLLGLRSPVNTLARLLNPARAPYSLQSVFHPAYAPLHQDADALLQQANALVFKGEGGEAEIKPHATTQCLLLRRGEQRQLQWPRLLPAKPTPLQVLSGEELVRLWRGQANDSYGEMATTETCACALLLLERADSVAEARAMAQHFWQARQRDRY